MVIAGVVALAGLILFLRRPDSLLNPQFFAEDGMFFLDAYDMGPMAILTPYGGYLHLVPRLTACFALAFDPRWMPVIYNGVAFTFWLVVILALFSPRIPLPAKPALALALVLVPHTGEVFISLTNAQWPMALGLVLLLIATDADTPIRRVFDCGVVLLCGLSGPFSIFLLPLFIIRAATRRSRDSIVLAITVAVVAGVQAVSICRFPVPLLQPGPRDPAWLLSVMGGRLYGTFFAGYRLSQFQPSAAWITIGLGLTALGGLAVFHSGSWSRAQKMLAGAWLCFAVPVAIKFLRDSGAIAGPLNGDRYFFLPHVLLAWVLVIFSAKSGGWKRILAMAAVAAAVMANAPYFRVQPMHDYAWAQHVQPIREGKGFRIPVNPEGWYLQSAGKNSRR